MLARTQIEEKRILLRLSVKSNLDYVVLTGLSEDNGLIHCYDHTYAQYARHKTG